jgi:putative endonuclease
MVHVRGGYVYIMSNPRRTVLYIGVTNSLLNRVNDHKNGIGCSFTNKYNCTDLIYFECFGFIEEAIKREKQLKNWHRPWKIELIRQKNPDMVDLSDTIEEYR